MIKNVGDFATALWTLKENLAKISKDNSKLDDRLDHAYDMIHELTGQLLTFQALIDRQDEVSRQLGKRLDDQRSYIEDIVKLRIKEVLLDVDGQAERLNTLVSAQGKRQLERLAFYYGLTQRAMLEQLFADAEQTALSALPADTRGDYYDKRRPLRSNDPTPKSE